VQQRVRYVPCVSRLGKTQTVVASAQAFQSQGGEGEKRGASRRSRDPRKFFHADRDRQAFLRDLPARVDRHVCVLNGFLLLALLLSVCIHFTASRTFSLALPTARAVYGLHSSSLSVGFQMMSEEVAGVGGNGVNPLPAASGASNPSRKLHFASSHCPSKAHRRILDTADTPVIYPRCPLKRRRTSSIPIYL
jgi:hypothetical protein